MKCEELVSVLKSAGVEVLNEDEFGRLDEDLNLVRDLRFCVDDSEYSIVWFNNMMTLHTWNSTQQTMFTRIEHSGTWPNNFKRNLQMYYKDDCVCVIGLERYPV